MAKFVKLTLASGDVEYVNLDNIVKASVAEADDDDNPDKKFTWLEDIQTNTFGPYVEDPGSFIS